MLRIAVHGAAGRMGRRVVALAAAAREVEVVAALVRPGDPRAGEPAGAPGLVFSSEIPEGARPDAAIDFSTPEAAERFLALCAARRVPLVLATTGLAAEQDERIAEAARAIAVLRASNLSLGVALAVRLCREAARALGAAADVEVVEAHHRKKRDAPGGTALTLARAVADARGQRPDAVVFGRPGYGRVATEDRPAGEIAVHALRLGDVVGEHTVSFGFGSERLEISHKAHSRDVFAAGALEAARFLAGAPPGLYGPEDVLFPRPAARP
jgi:4-hydroxy-tetrahydrodipicolinate reductase